MNILGVHYGHDASAALIVDGAIVANVAEERLTRIKNDGSFPYKAIAMCLELGGISSEEIDVLAIPSPYIPPAFFTYFRMPVPPKSKPKEGLLGKVVRRLKGIPAFVPPEILTLPLYQKPFALSPSCKLHNCEHHRAHAASAYYTSGLTGERTLIATMDGLGGSVSATISVGENGKIAERYRVGKSGSLGWFYSNVTEALGWRHGSGEWKVMGLAPYGKAVPGLFEGFHPKYKDGRLEFPHSYGGFDILNDHGVNHYHGNDAKPLQRIISGVPREDAAAETQRVAEEQAMHFLLPWLKTEGVRHLCCAGGFFLNVKFNQKLWYRKELETQWIYPDCGDSGLAVGAALDAYHSHTGSEQLFRLEDLYHGPEYTNTEIKALLDERGLVYSYSENPAEKTAEYLSRNLVAAWFQGRMEAGPRALGNRSILMSPLKRENKDIINEKVKYREKFRPFCPSMTAESRDKYLLNARDEEYMVTSFEVLDEQKEEIPAVVHEDSTVRPQMVRRTRNPLFYQLIESFSEREGVDAILNTSFNIRGEPIVCHPREAIRCFFDTGLDVLIMGNYILEKPALATEAKV